MIELLILFILQKQGSNIYKIKKFIDINFCVFYKTSLGTILPALKRLETKEFIASSKTITDGGQKKSDYFITTKGKNRLIELLISPLSSNPLNAEPFIEATPFILAENILSKEEQTILIKNILKHLEIRKSSFKKLSEQFKDIKIQKKYMENSQRECEEKITFFKSFV